MMNRKTFFKAIGILAGSVAGAGLLSSIPEVVEAEEYPFFLLLGDVIDERHTDFSFEDWKKTSKELDKFLASYKPPDNLSIPSHPNCCCILEEIYG